MRIAAAWAVGLVLLCAPASAQTQADIVSHYRAYNAAMERNDLVTAETEAEAAFAASEAVNGSRTGVLALNLALVRLSTNDAAGALAPAQRAFALAQSGAVGVDANLAAITLGRAELATSGQAGADRLQPLLLADNVSAPVADVYAAAMELGIWALNHQQLEMAESAGGVAAAHASGAFMGERFGLGRARTMEATAIFMSEIGGRGYSRMDQNRARDAYMLIGEALMALDEASMVEPPDGRLTVAQLAFAQAMALRGAIRSKALSDGMRLPQLSAEAEGDADGMAEMGPRIITLQRCMVHLQQPRNLQFPGAELSRNQLGAVALWVRLNEAGEVIEHSAVANLGAEGFVEEVNESGPWRVRRQEDSPANCRMPRMLLATIVFQMR